MFYKLPPESKTKLMVGELPSPNCVDGSDFFVWLLTIFSLSVIPSLCVLGRVEVVVLVLTHYN